MNTRRTLAALAAVLVAGVVAAPPAGAHTLSGASPTNYRSEIMAVTPPAPGVDIALLDLGRKVELRNTTGDEVIVLGYEGEPYLRVDGDGVFENLRSPTLYLNRSDGPDPVPPDATAGADPDWERRSGGTSVTWADRRTRWEGANPPEVQARPGERHVVQPAWTISLTVDGDPVDVVGRIVFVPPPSMVPWIVVTLGLAALASMTGWSDRWPVWLSVALATVVAVDIVHSVGLAAADGAGLGRIMARLLARSPFMVVAWAVGAWAVAALQRKRQPALFAAVGVGLLVAVIGGLTDLTSLSRSQVPYAFPAVTARAAVAASLGLGLGVAAAAGLALRASE